MRFADLIRDARTRKRLSQRQLGEQILTPGRPKGIWDTYIGQIEKGEKIPSDELCVKIARALQLDVRDLLLCAYIERSDGEARELFEQVSQFLRNPVFDYLLKRMDKIGLEQLKAFEDPDFAAAISDVKWRNAFVDGFRMKDRDLLGLIEAVGKMKKIQWEALVNMVKVLQSG
jgi:transcriptional regulator with XRE-family HTH domain